MIIRKTILFHLRLYNNNNYDIYHFSKIPLNDLSTYKYRNYLRVINLKGEDSKIVLTKDKYPISSSVEHIYIDCSNFILGDHWIPDTLSSISFSKFDQALTRNIIGNTLKTINFGVDFNEVLSDSNGIPWLPRTIESIRFGKSFQQSIHRGELPPSLTSLTLNENYKGIILNGSIPKPIKDLNYHFNSNDNTIRLIPNSTVKKKYSKSIPGGTTSLEFDYHFNQTIKKGMIPHNVTSLEFKNYEGCPIEANSLPISIKTLVLGGHETPYNYKDILPPNITNLTLISCSDYKSLPKSIEKLKIETFLEPLLINPFSGFKHLTSLNCTTDEHNLPDGIFPNSLTTLTLYCRNLQLTNNLLPKNLKVLKLYGYNQPINVGHLPSSIEILKLRSFSQPIQKNVLPQSLTSLHLDTGFNSTIERDALPPNLKSFYLTGFGTDFKELPDLIWPSSFESLYIPKDNFDIINSISLDFFIKHVTLIS
ncbi:hypothetical protein ACTFIR_004837 [Dictyostelium discoideum]